MKQGFKRFLSSLLVLVMFISMAPSAAFAEDIGISEDFFTEAQTVPTEYEDKLCEHHPDHEGCAYKEAKEASPCNHEHNEACYTESVACVHSHDASCGYIPAIEGTPCNHSHDASCAFVEAVAEVPCDCEAQHIHEESCGAAPGMEGAPCSHAHDEFCGYADAVAEIPCDCMQEEHTAECRYVPAVSGMVCQHGHDELCGFVQAVAEIPCDCEVKIVHAENCSAAPGVEGVACTHTHDEVCGYSDGVPAQGECVHVCTEASGCVIKTLACQHAHDETCGFSEDVEAVDCDYECGICGVKVEFSRELRIENVEEENDELYNAYVESLFFDYESQLYSGTQGYEKLTSVEQNIYKYLKPVIVDTANGERNNTKISLYHPLIANNTYSAQSAVEKLDLLMDVIYRALVQDCAYEFYWSCYLIWYDGYVEYQGYGKYKIVITDMGIPVSPNYRRYTNDAFSFNTSKATTPKLAAANAKSIVSQYSSLSDYNKLLAYKNKICDLVYYDYNAIYQDNYHDVDINPWGLVYVFDNDPSTNVVCEGYAEAFQYLCELSYFTGDVESIIVSGDAGGPHRWNVVSIEDKNYVVDVTWCDHDGGGSDNRYFLVGADSGSVAGGYKVKGSYRFYDTEDILLWGSGADSILKLASSDYVPPTTSVKAPTLKITNRASDGKPSLSWNSVGASSYEIYRASSSGGTYSKLNSTSGTSYIDTNAAAGVTYYYKVKAIVSGASATSSVVSTVCDLARPTTTISNDVSTGKPKVSWTAIPGAVKYEVWGRSSKTNTYKKLWNTVKTSYTHTDAEVGETYYYQVRAVYSNTAANSAYSAGKSTVCDLARPTTTVSNDVSTGKPKVSWTAIPGAVKYEVWGRTSKTSTYKKLWNTVKTSFTHTDAEAGETYYYQVRAVYSNTAANSAYSAGKNTVCDLARPTTTVSNDVSTGKPKVSWTAIPGAVKYEVWGRSSKTNTYKKLWNTVKTSYTHTDAEVGETYYYQVRAVYSNTAANSAYSAGKGTVCDLARPTVAISNDTRTGKPKVSWTAIPDAVKYEVWGRSSKTNTYKKLWNTVKTSYTHTDAEVGETYYYQVRAVYSNTAANSAYSATKSITSK